MTKRIEICSLKQLNYTNLTLLEANHSDLRATLKIQSPGSQSTPKNDRLKREGSFHMRVFKLFSSLNYVLQMTTVQRNQH